MPSLAIVDTYQPSRPYPVSQQSDGIQRFFQVWRPGKCLIPRIVIKTDTLVLKKVHYVLKRLIPQIIGTRSILLLP